MSTGKNDPCHCGSGKKFKHCCINKPTQDDSKRRVVLAGAIVGLVAIVSVLFALGFTQVGTGAILFGLIGILLFAASGGPSGPSSGQDSSAINFGR